jgi:hypothetical protein
VEKSTEDKAMTYGLILCHPARKVRRYNVVGVLPALVLAMWYRAEGWAVTVLEEMRKER